MAQANGTSPAEHTPGPWGSDRVSTIYLTPDECGEMTVYEITTPHHSDFNVHAWVAGEANARFIGAAPDVRQASQKLYDALQRYLMGGPLDSELPAELVEGMNELEAAWHKADGTVPETN